MAAGYGVAIKAIAGGVSGGLSGIASNQNRSNILNAYGNLPMPPDLWKQYQKGYWNQIQETPGLLNLDEALREQYLPKELALASSQYGKFLPKFAQSNLAALKGIDPQFIAGRNQLFGTVSGDLTAGSGLTPDMQSELEGYIRGGQSARGNVLGNAPVAAEALYKGQAGQALKEQRIQNMMRFLTGPAPEDKFGELAGAAGPALGQSMLAATNPGFSYIEGPHNWAGERAGLSQQTYQDQYQRALAIAGATAAAGPKVNPWLTSLAGGLGAIAGTGSGGGSGGGGGGGGGFGSMFGGGGGGGTGGTYSGYSAGGLGEFASPTYL